MNTHAHASADKANPKGVHKPPAGRTLFFQSKLAINPPDDHCKREANTTADRVMRMPVQRQSDGPDVERRFGLGMRNRFGLYDAELNRDTNTLTLLMRIQFDFTGAWASDQDQQNWVTDFINHVQNRWSYRFYLVPESICPNTHETIFSRVNVQSVTSDPHYTVEVAASSRRSTANSQARTARLDALDNDMMIRNRLGQDFQQRASEHEFGHMLGVPHIECDPQTGTCPSGDPYGDTIDERGDIMGSGWIVSARDYTPFTTAMYYFTGCNWKASHTPVYPIGDYPMPGRASHIT